MDLPGTVNSAVSRSRLRAVPWYAAEGSDGPEGSPHEAIRGPRSNNDSVRSVHKDVVAIGGEPEEASINTRQDGAHIHVDRTTNGSVSATEVAVLSPQLGSERGVDTSAKLAVEARSAEEPVPGKQSGSPADEYTPMKRFMPHNAHAWREWSGGALNNRDLGSEANDSGHTTRRKRVNRRLGSDDQGGVAVDQADYSHPSAPLSPHALGGRGAQGKLSLREMRQRARTHLSKKGEEIRRRVTFPREEGIGRRSAARDGSNPLESDASPPTLLGGVRVGEGLAETANVKIDGEGGDENDCDTGMSPVAAVGGSPLRLPPRRMKASRVANNTNNNDNNDNNLRVNAPVHQEEVGVAFMCEGAPQIAPTAIEDTAAFGDTVMSRIIEPHEAVKSPVTIVSRHDNDDGGGGTDRITAEGALVKLTSNGGTQYVIPAWDQFVVEYLFPEAFKEDIDYSEFFSLALQFGTMLLNVVMVGINVFSNDINNPSYTIRVLSFVVFVSELAVVWVSFALFLIVGLDGLVRSAVGTNYVVDLVDLSTFTGSFSAFKVLAYASPSRMIKMLGARWQTAYDCCDYSIIFALVFAWIIGFIFATTILTLKITQVDFIFTRELPEWTWMEFIQLFGLANNLSGIDLSYSATTGTLFDALHNHYCGPGGPISPETTTEGLFTKMKSGLGLENVTRSYEFIECIFDSNFKFSKSTTKEKAAHASNFMAFILRLDATKLQQLLQMTRSPLHFYSNERISFEKALRDGDENAMLEAVQRADPLSREVSDIGKGHKMLPRFHLYYTCEENDLPVQLQRKASMGRGGNDGGAAVVASHFERDVDTIDKAVDKKVVLSPHITAS